MHESAYWSYGKYGLKTLFSSLLFFYSHFSLLAIALIPSLIRAYQMWNQLQTPVFLEVVVELTRIVLFIYMLCLLSKVNSKSLRQQAFWDKLGDSCSLHLQKSWPKFFLAQIVIFIVFLYGVGNLIITAIVHISLSYIVEAFNFGDSQFTTDAAYNALLFFLKNMSVIPLAMVYILKMIGIGETEQ